MGGKTCRSCGRDFASGEQFCPTDGSRLSTPSQFGNKQTDPLIGSTLENRYRILRVIGEGGMGVVYEAQHVMIEKQVAIKVLRETFTSRPDVVERFRQEAKSASKIGHPNIVDVSDFGETATGQSFIVMEMLVGEDLADVLSRERILAPARAVRIAYQVARALHATHKKNIVHRDLKPENVYLIERDGSAEIVKVVDFGVAKMNDVETPAGRRLTRTGMIFGTPEYMSPEQALGKPFDHRVDIYALGAICFELLTGRVPFEGENFMEILAKHGHAELPTIREANAGVRISAELERVVMRALAKDPDKRYQTMGELANELRAVPEMPAAEPGDALDWGPPTAEIDRPSQPVASLASLAEALPLPAAANLGPVAAGSSLPTAALGSPLAAAGSVSAFPAVASRLDANPLSSLLSAIPAAAAQVGPEAGSAAGEVPLAALAALPVARRGAAGSRHAQPPARSHWRRPLALAAAISCLSLMVGFWVRHSRQTSATLSSLAEEPVRATAPAPAVAATTVTTTTAAATAPEVLVVKNTTPTLVNVHVRTQPSGARVRVLGTDTECAAAPCTLALPRSRPVTLRAENGNASIERTLTFEDTSAVELRVHPWARKTALKPSSPSARHAGSDLKVPEFFRGREAAHSK